MTPRLERAFAEAAKRPAAEQELLASRVLAELEAEDDWTISTAQSPRPPRSWRGWRSRRWPSTGPD